MLATLFNIPRDLVGLNQFSFANQDQHNQIAQKLSAFNISVPSYVLDPMPTGSALGVWLYNHQTMHDVQNAALGINGNDLTSLDFNRPDELAAWIDIHAKEHAQAAQLLGI